MEHEIYLEFIRINEEIIKLNDKVEGILKATGLKPKEEEKEIENKE